MASISEHFRRIRPLLVAEGDKVSGPMSPVLLAKEVGEQVGMHYNAIGRVVTSDEEVFQWNEGTFSRPSLTGHDVLLFGEYSFKYKRFKSITLWVDMGSSAMPVGFMGIDKDPILTPIYEKDTKFEKKPSKTEIATLLLYAHDHPETILPVIKSTDGTEQVQSNSSP